MKWSIIKYYYLLNCEIFSPISSIYADTCRPIQYVLRISRYPRNSKLIHLDQNLWEGKLWTVILINSIRSNWIVGEKNYYVAYNFNH